MTNVTKDKGLLEKLQRRLGDTVPSTDTLMLAIAKAPKPVVHNKYLRSILAKKNHQGQSFSTSIIPALVLSLVLGVAATKSPGKHGIGVDS